METLQDRIDSVRASSDLFGGSSKDGPHSLNEYAPSMHEPFQNLDDPAVLRDSMQALSASTSRNFVLEFGDSHAHVAFNLDSTNLQTVLDTDRQDVLGSRWINIWYPFHQRSVLEVLARQYDFSPRLLALMCADPRRQPRTDDSSSYAIAAKQEYSLSDLESGIQLSTQSPDVVSLSSYNGSRTGNLYDIVDEVWHYSSVDQGRSYLCLGFNSLFAVGHLYPEVPGSEQRSDHEQIHQPLPHVRRIWTWLLLLSDHTVVTITEDPFPYSSAYLTSVQQHVLNHTRRNLNNVFRSLSKVDLDTREKSPLTLLPIRRRLGETPEETAHRKSDASGLLFYYLFENWENSYSLVTRKESRYGIELQRVRKEMFTSPKLAHIDRLDQIGCQLAVLKKHYNSYLRLIDRVVAPQQASIASLTNSRVIGKTSRESLSPGFAAVPAHGTIFASSTQTGQPVTNFVPGEGGGDGLDVGSLLGVSLSSAARVRFERLRDMISLYALSECQEYLHQKESLVQMNFQLIAIKESVDVERLTRAAYLISKATVLFLPVSFMTAYFSADFGKSYSVKTYWISFAIVLGLSWLVLVGFGAISGTLESWKIIPGMKQLVRCVNRMQEKREIGDGRSSIGPASVDSSVQGRNDRIS